MLGLKQLLDAPGVSDIGLYHTEDGRYGACAGTREEVADHPADALRALVRTNPERPEARDVESSTVRALREGARRLRELGDPATAAVLDEQRQALEGRDPDEEERLIKLIRDKCSKIDGLLDNGSPTMKVLAPHTPEWRLLADIAERNCQCCTVSRWQADRLGDIARAAGYDRPRFEFGKVRDTVAKLRARAERFEWWARDLSFKAPEQLPGRVAEMIEEAGKK